MSDGEEEEMEMTLGTEQVDDSDEHRFEHFNRYHTVQTVPARPSSPLYRSSCELASSSAR